MAFDARGASRVSNRVGVIAMSFHFAVPDELGRCNCPWWPLGGESDVVVVVIGIARRVSVRVP